ncbi:MAG TPA: hypothetical protein H9831_11750 [Candidatus Eisenbergiella pullistercoris]|uniref:GP-PDE domain-containing protein n=1 Tax=Candidatus Eisenbergiella pullistercoris TaxID=2838555 RepID=A0A9D2C8B3_9FIRM|nr:hypothetical protein [Candidatus Eisenbergiella pullistercoris]
MGKEIRKEIEESSEGAAVKAASFRRPARIAHRGDIWSGPENTMSAFWGAVRKGCEGIEMDIRRTADGKIVVAHDAGFGRVMCGCTEPEKRSIREMTLEQVCRIPLPFAGHLLDCFPDEGLANELYSYFPWDLDDRETIRARAMQLLSASEGLPAEERFERMFSWFHENYCDIYRVLKKRDGRLDHYIPLEDFLKWMDTQPEGFFAEIEYKEDGLVEETDRLIRSTGTARRCILFSGIDSVNQEIQNFYRENGKPDGLRLGANIRFLNDKTLPFLQEWDLYEVGLNAGTYGTKETDFLHEKGILVFSNLGDIPSWWEEMNGNGTDGFKTNCLGKYNEWLEKQVSFSGRCC